ncbi:MAG: Flp family type IVb pilin [Acidobacteria bacterium]|nr:Flp family type IVb pilin [Acidobacteriota bacterium]
MRLRALVRDETAQDLMEYALLVTLIALVVVGALTVTGTNVSAVFTDIANKIVPAG